jgi:hypothetical protein
VSRRGTELEAGQRSVTAAIDLSYRHLSGDQQRMFALLGLHPGPDIDAYAAAALATFLTTRQAERLLDDLVDAHLLEPHQPGNCEQARKQWRQALDILEDLGVDHVEEITAGQIRAHLAALASPKAAQIEIPGKWRRYQGRCPTRSYFPSGAARRHAEEHARADATCCDGR